MKFIRSWTDDEISKKYCPTCRYSDCDEKGLLICKISGDRKYISDTCSRWELHRELHIVSRILSKSW